MNRSQQTQVVPIPPQAVSALAALAFASRGQDSVAAGRHLAFLPLESLELDLSDPEQRDFGDYELLEQLGQGGMGVVYRAKQRSLDREVALKLLSAGPWASPEFIARFTREAQSAARLQHPNIVSIYEIGAHAELNFFSMALVRGASLAQKVEATGPLKPRDAAALVRIVAEAVDYAHRLGILHLDLKPANVMLDERGEPQVADFGLAKRLDETLSNDSEEVSGTPSYMAPEQAQVKSHRLSAATDIYGLGAILYELLTGRPPFLGATARDTLQLVVDREPVRPSEFDRTLPEDLEAICLKCLAKDPRQRYVTARGLAEDLGRFLEGRAVSVRPLNAWQRMQRWARREPKVAVAAALALAALFAGLVATSLQWRRAELQSQRAELGAAQVRETLWQKRSDDAAILLRQYKSLDTLPDLVQNLTEQEAVGAHAQAELSRLRIGSVLADTPVLVDALAVEDRILNVLLDPAGRWVVVTTGVGGGVQRFDLASGAQRWIIKHGVIKEVLRLTLASDGRHLIAEVLNAGVPVARGLATHLIDLDSGERREPPEALFPRRYGTHFSPDASHALVVTNSTTQGGSPQGRLVRVADWQVLGPERSLPGLALLGPGGTWFAYCNNTSDDDRATSDPVEVIDPSSMTRRWQYLPASGAALRGWRIAPDGRSLALGFADGEMGLFDPMDGARRPLPSRVNAPVDDFFFSGDGSWLAASHRDGSVQVWDVANAAPVTLPLHLSADQTAVVGTISLDPGSRRLYIGEESARLWYLPGPEHAAEVLFERPAYLGAIVNTANAASIEQGLFVGGALDGELRVWRYRPRAPLRARAPLREMRDAVRRFDGRHALHVDGARVQLRGMDANSDGVVLEFPQAVGFAQVVPESRFVVASAGRELHVRDAFSGTPRYSPRVLPATPSALLVSPDGRRMVAAWQAHDGKAATLALRSIDSASGATLGESSLKHPSYSVQISDDGESVIGWWHQNLVLLDAVRLQPRWAPRNFAEAGEYNAVRGARLGRDGRTLWVMSGVGAEDGYRLHALEAASGGEAQVWRLPAWAMALQPYDHGEAVVAVIPNRTELRLLRRGGEERVVKLAGLDSWGYFGMALSEDERRLAVGLKRGIQWLDLPSGNWLSPPLQPPASGLEFAGVALDPTGSIALMRDSERRQWRYELLPETRPVHELQTLVRLLTPSDQDAPDVFSPPRDPALRAALRAADPGPPALPVEPSMALPATGSSPPAAPELRFVDLRPRCNVDLAGYPGTTHLNLRLDRLLAPGRQRLLGIDFEVHCGIATLYAPSAPANVTLGSRIEGIAVAQSEVAAVELLLLAPTMSKDQAHEDYAVIEFVYRDSSRARTSLVYGRDIDAWFNPDYGDALTKRRVAYVGLGAQFSQTGGNTVAPALYAVRVVNPHPERAVASLALESTRHPWSEPLLLAATLESIASPAQESIAGDTP